MSKNLLRKINVNSIFYKKNNKDLGEEAVKKLDKKCLELDNKKNVFEDEFLLAIDKERQKNKFKEKLSINNQKEKIESRDTKKLSSNDIENIIKKMDNAANKKIEQTQEKYR